jgi:RimJ/RimL family protein N-acetyltransferase
VLNAIAEKRNTGSNRVIQKTGFHYVGEVDIEDDILNHYKLTKSEWISAQSSLTKTPIDMHLKGQTTV